MTDVNPSAEIELPDLSWYNAEIEKGARESMSLDEDWYYKDLPWVKDEFWPTVTALVEEGAMKILVQSTRNDWEGGPYHHAQVMYNPKLVSAYRLKQAK